MEPTKSSRDFLAYVLPRTEDGERGSYPGIVDALAQHGAQGKTDAHALYRREVFNVDRDHHPAGGLALSVFALDDEPAAEWSNIHLISCGSWQLS
jgi:hypothetical protein